MPLVHRLLITLRTLMEEEPEPPKSRRRRPNHGNRNCNRNRQTTALILTFRDLFRSSGLNIILDEMEVNRRSPRKSSHNSACNTTNNTIPESALCVTSQQCHVSDSRVTIGDQNVPVTALPKSTYQDETFPLLQEETIPVVCTDLVPSTVPIYPSGLFRRLAVSGRNHSKPKDLTVPLNPDDENKTVETLKKVLKWSPRKQNSATFAVSLPTEGKHTALAVVENAVNRVKEEQLRKKKRKFLCLKFC